MTTVNWAQTQFPDSRQSCDFLWHGRIPDEEEKVVLGLDLTLKCLLSPGGR